MVHFEKDKLIIEIDCFNPAETWVELHNALYDVMVFINQDTLNPETFLNIPMLLSAMLPDADTAKKMTK